MRNTLTPRGFALAATALQLASATRAARGKKLAPSPVRAVGPRRKPAAK